jgi:hypothetical protein
MPRGYRCILFALVGVALAGAGPPNQPDQNSAAKRNQTEALTPAYKPYPDRNGEDCYRDSNHDAADLCAQWRAAYAAEKTTRLTNWGNWIAGVGALLSFASVILVLIALRQGRRANEIAQEGSYRDLRAYLSIEVVSEDIAETFLGGRIVIKNAGQTPAQFRLFHTTWIGPWPEGGLLGGGPDPEESVHHHPYINRGATEKVQWFWPMPGAEDDGAAKEIKKITEIKNAAWALFVYGRVEFTDFMRRERVLHFSYRNNVSVAPGGIFEMVPVPEGNHYEDRSYKPLKSWRDHFRALRDVFSSASYRELT